MEQLELFEPMPVFRVGVRHEGEAMVFETQVPTWEDAIAFVKQELPGAVILGSVNPKEK